MAGMAVQLQDLAKRYLIGANRQRGYRTLREAVTDGLAAPMRMLRAGAALGRTEEFWALRNVSFDVGDGEVVGIIGRNGAGKSTLLKILSGITPPSTGRAVLSGRVGSLLEVGTGFHPELSGRENIYLNGSILGMRRREIAKKFDAIVDFSGVDNFLDTPVKRYSSGMRVRLAFAVAAFLEPEILIVDEVLAVGDVEFQRKCLGTMKSVAASGRTVLFVSHNMPAVSSLCTRGILLEAGRVSYDGPIADAVANYLSLFGTMSLEYRNEEPVVDTAIVRRVVLCGCDGEPLKSVATDTQIGVRIECEVKKSHPMVRLAFVLNDAQGNPLFASCPTDSGKDDPVVEGLHVYHARFPTQLLMSQQYSLSVAVYSPGIGAIDRLPHVLKFDVAEGPSMIHQSDRSRKGVIQYLCDWEHNLRAA